MTTGDGVRRHHEIAPLAATELEPGNVLLDRYRIAEKLGEGGYGVVYRAKDLKMRRDVALKCLRETSAAARKALLREAQRAAPLDHENIVKVWEYHDGSDAVLLSLEFAPGGSLSDLMTREPALPLARVASILDDMSAALDHAHGQGLVHRDLKPGNILLNRKGRALLADFGLACVLEESSTATSTSDVVLGTVLYTAPERFSDPWTPYAASADIYALGAVLYQMLTNRPHRSGRTLVEIHASAPTRPPPPSTLRADLPRAVDGVLMRVLSPAPGERHATARELSEDFRRALEPVTQVDATEVRLLLERARSLSSRGKRNEALRLLGEFAGKHAADPESLPVLLETGRQLLDVEDYEGAGSVFRQALQLDGQSAEARQGLARAERRRHPDRER